MSLPIFGWDQAPLSNTDPQDRPGRKEEVWCNRVAAKLLVPREELKAKLGADVPRAALISARTSLQG